MKNTILIVFLILFGIILWFCVGVYYPKEMNQTSTSFLIEKGTGVNEIALNLEKQGLIKDKTLFKIYVFLTGRSSNLQAGKYSLSSSMSISKITKNLVLGNVVKEKITILEGWTSKDIAEYFLQKGIVKKEDFFSFIQNSFSFSFLNDKPKERNLEGYLFPDTYELSYGDSLGKIINSILENFDNKLTLDLRNEIIKQKKTIFEIVIMASLIEKEVKTIDDKKVVSGILWKRLAIGMPLQVDATILYITGNSSSNILIKDTKIDSLYNTYKYKGLPLGPISNPGIESIEAAIFPKSSPYLYYLSTKDGKTIFSKTLEEHNINKAKYLK